MAKRVLVILGHPSDKSLSAALAQAYIEGAEAAGHELKYISVGQLAFDPILHEGYREIQELEPDLKAAQESLLWAEHIVVVFPIWWGTMPAILQGFFERILLPGYAYKYQPNRMVPDKLLLGRSAHVISTMGMPKWLSRFYTMPGFGQMRKNIFSFCGIKPTKYTIFGNIPRSTPEERASWIAEVKKLASKL